MPPEYGPLQFVSSVFSPSFMLRPTALVPVFSRLALAALAALACAGAHAEKADRDQPMNIEADALRHEEKSQTSTFTGHVVLTKGSILMRGARLQVQQAGDGQQSGTLTAEKGERAFFRQKRDGADEYIEGEAETIEYDSRADTVRLQGRARMRRLEGAKLADEVTGARITYHSASGVYTVDGAPQGKAGKGERIRATLGPRGAGAQPAQPAALRGSSSLSKKP